MLPRTFVIANIVYIVTVYCTVHNSPFYGIFPDVYKCIRWMGKWFYHTIFAWTSENESVLTICYAFYGGSVWYDSSKILINCVPLRHELNLKN